MRVWNAGNSDPNVGKAIWEYVFIMFRQLGWDNPLRGKLDKVLGPLTAATRKMGYAHTASWFDDIR